MPTGDFRNPNSTYMLSPEEARRREIEREKEAKEQIAVFERERPKVNLKVCQKCSHFSINDTHGSVNCTIAFDESIFFAMIWPRFTPKECPYFLEQMVSSDA